jgi:AI-2E family transporter
VGLSLLGIPNAILWGVLAALLRFIPYIGPWVAAAFPIALALAVFSGWTIPLLTIGLILVLELVSNNVVEPWVYGTGTGVSAGALLVAAIFWTWIWGVPGLFLATPLTVCLAVIGKHVPALGFLAVLLGDEAVLPPEAKLYQRLLAMDQEEASEVLLAQLEEKTLVEVFDDTLIPALVLAERDHHGGTLDDQTQRFVIQAMRELVEEAGDWRRDLTRSEKRAEKEDEQPPPPPPEPRPVVKALCVAADDEADHVVALMAAQVLRQIGFTADVVEVATLTGQLGQIVEDQGAQLVLISDVPPSGFAHVRYICKRLAVKSPDLPIIVGVWGSTLDAQKARQRLPEYGSLNMVKSLKETVACAQQLLEGLRLGSGTPGRHPEEASVAAPEAGGPAVAQSRLV